MAGYTARMAAREEHLAVRRWTFDKAVDVSAPTAESLAAQLKDYYVRFSSKQKEQAVSFMKSLGSRDLFLEKVIESHALLLATPNAEAELRESYQRQGIPELLDQYEREVEAAGTDVQDTAAANRSTEKGGSWTAKSTCMLRHLAATLGFGPDCLARLFVCAEEQQSLQAMKVEFDKSGVLPYGGKSLKEKQDQAPHKFFDSTVYLQSRTCLGDDAVLQWVEDHPNGSNVVLLGAGYDTRFYRLNLPETAQLFEVDAIGTQQEKLKILQESGKELPNTFRVRYVATDFQSENWMERLVATGLDKALPTFIVWEGVSYYLPREVVEQTLRAVASDFAGPCALFFDYFHPQLVEENNEMLKAMGEPWLFGIASAGLEELVTSVGLKLLDHLSIQECLQRYVPVDAQGKSLGVGSPWKFFAIAGNALCH